MDLGFIGFMFCSSVFQGSGVYVLFFVQDFRASKVYRVFSWVLVRVYRVSASGCMGFFGLSGWNANCY